MKKVIKKPKKQKKLNKGGRFLVTFFLFGGLILTVAALLSPQYIRQFAQYSAPPLFGCLHTGAADPSDCGTRMGNTGQVSFSLYGRPVPDNNQLVYYNDTLSGSYDYSNTGDQPIAIKSMGIAAGALSQYYIADFNPLQGPTTIQPKQNVTIKTSSHQFGDPDPNGNWVIGAGLTDTSGQHLPVDTSTTVKVVAACTALRVKPLTSQDKSDMQTLCKNNPTSSLCTSKQYCQIFKGGSCPQEDVSPDVPGQQCDDAIVLAKPEQDMLEQLCKTYPDTDACQDFCDRSIGSPICPQVMVDDAGDPIADSNSSAVAASTPTGPRAVAGAEIALGPIGAVPSCGGPGISATCTPTDTTTPSATVPPPAPAPAPAPAPVVPAPPAPAPTTSPVPPPAPKPVKTTNLASTTTKTKPGGSNPSTNNTGSGTGSNNSGGPGGNVKPSGKPSSSGTAGGSSGTSGGSQPGGGKGGAGNSASGTSGNIPPPKNPGQPLSPKTCKKNSKHPSQCCALHATLQGNKCVKGKGKGGKGGKGASVTAAPVPANNNPPVPSSNGGSTGGSPVNPNPPIVPPNYNVPVGGLYTIGVGTYVTDNSQCFNVGLTYDPITSTCAKGVGTGASAPGAITGGSVGSTGSSCDVINCGAGTVCTPINDPKGGTVFTCTAPPAANPAPVAPASVGLQDGAVCTPTNDQCAKKNCGPATKICGGI